MDRREHVRRRIVPIAGVALFVAALLPGGLRASASAGGTAAATTSAPFCEARTWLCPDTRSHTNYEGDYVGHDEPAILFYSDVPGSGNSNKYNLRIPGEAPTLPAQHGGGGTWNFQRSIAFWFGMALCESESYPNPGEPCTPRSDANIKDSADPTAPDWIGNHVGTGFLELQFYPPGWADAVSCDATQWCTAMAVFGLSDDLTQTNNLDCLQRAGEEWANFAFLTHDGTPHAPPSPLAQTGDSFTFHPDTDLSMNPNDKVRILIHDSPAGLVTTVKDLTTGEKGSMTASVANGFAHPLFQPDAATCTEAPYAFHPMYATSGVHTRVPWAAHSYNVAFSDEIGHFEYCDVVNTATGRCKEAGGQDEKVDTDDFPCFDASQSLLAPVSGCIGTDFDFDGEAYQPVWSGTDPDPSTDAALHSPSFVLTSPTFNHGKNYSQIAFEADLPAIEFGTVPPCNTATGENCVNPPVGTNFYPIYSTRGTKNCGWQEGGTNIPGTVNTFGGTSTSEYGPIYALAYPTGPSSTGFFFENFRNILSNNPCESSGKLPA
jgi:hypothetical protein